MPKLDLVVYTVVTGAYDILRPSKWPAICLTDGTAAASEGWEMRKVEMVGANPQQASRYPKILAHLFFPDTEYTLYVDGNFDLFQDPQKVVAEYLQNGDMALFAHPQRACVYEEAAATIKLGKAGREVIERQVAFYRKEGLPARATLAACALIIRRNTPMIQEFCKQWWVEYMRFPENAHNDQLSFGYVQWMLGVKYDIIPGNIFKGTRVCRKRIGHPIGRKWGSSKRRGWSEKRRKKAREARKGGK